MGYLLQMLLNWVTDQLVNPSRTSISAINPQKEKWNSYNHTNQTRRGYHPMHVCSLIRQTKPNLSYPCNVSEFPNPNAVMLERTRTFSSVQVTSSVTGILREKMQNKSVDSRERETQPVLSESRGHASSPRR